MLALLSTSIPLAMTMTATLIAVDRKNNLLPNPTAKDLKASSSVHVLAFSSFGEILVVDSEGEFAMEVWEDVHIKAKEICLGKEKGVDEEDIGMGGAEDESLSDVLRAAVQGKLEREQRWKQNLG